MTLLESQERIRRRLQHGSSLNQVQGEVIDSAPLDEDQKAALWTYARSELSKRQERLDVPRLTLLSSAELERSP